MMCPYPMLIKNKYGYIRRVDCGKCIACRLNKAREWSVRIMNELVYHKDACFLTLTYDDDHLPEDYSISKREFQRWMKRFRRDINKCVRFFASGEYGDKGHRWINPHYHVILFGVSPVDDIFQNLQICKDGYECFLSSWPFGHCFTGDVTYDSACYVAKYTAKKLLANDGKVPLNDEFYTSRGLEPPFLLMSRRPGIGAKYVRDNKNRLQRRGYIFGKDGKKCGLPRFYKSKVYSDYHTLATESYVRDNLNELRERSGRVGKSIRVLSEEILENAKNIVDNFVKEMRIRKK